MIDDASSLKAQRCTWRWVPRVAVAGALLGVSAMSTAAMPLVCQLQAPTSVYAGEPVLLQWQLRNSGADPVHGLIWATPFEARWSAPYVSLRRDGLELKYRGRSVKRGDPGAQDYFSIAPGATRSASIDLAQAFDLSQAGHYEVRPQLVLHDFVIGAATQLPRPRSEHLAQALACNAVSFTVIAR